MIENSQIISGMRSIGGKRDNLFGVAYKFFPRSFLVKAIGITLTSSLYIYNYLLSQGVTSLLLRLLITVGIIAAVPTIALYLITLARAPRIRAREEKEAARLQHIAHGDRNAQKAKEQKAEQEVARLELVASGDRNARKVKDNQEDERWKLLNESLRLQNETVELASEERLLVAQQVKDLKEEGEVIRKGLVSDDLEARHVKDLKEDQRWDMLNERMRLQEETGELASEERLLVAQQVKEVKDEREVLRIGLALNDRKAQEMKDRKEDDRWDMLNERMRVQDETADDRSAARLHTTELKEVQDVERRQRVAVGDAKLQQVKDHREDERWDLLDQRMQLMEAMLRDIKAALPPRKS